MRNNCANFVSQVLRAGRWEYGDGFIPRNTASWAPNLSGPGGASWTWVNAAYQYTYVTGLMAIWTTSGTLIQETCST
ncbi:amidase domain-containing protein [Actinomyces israelii]|uniref:amidase domain-containing protein n=1 Tax=Actinomyces israelii TaxID=1659 RepID=UPI003C6CA105